jgi:hypothetical protein
MVHLIVIIKKGIAMLLYAAKENTLVVINSSWIQMLMFLLVETTLYSL